MVERDYVHEQLKKISFGTSRWNRAEIEELTHILLPDEKIYECVNGYYDGGVALLVATDIRVLLIDKKPMGFLNVDDLRFDMISDLDYSHRMYGAQINISCGSKNLVFKSYNQQRLRKLIGHIQHRITEIKREASSHAMNQKQHLEEINKQLQLYLIAQQQQLQRQMASNQVERPVKPDPQLADFLFAQRLMDEYKSNHGVPEESTTPPAENIKNAAEPVMSVNDQHLLDEMAEAGRKEVFGGADQNSHSHTTSASSYSAAADMNQGLDMTPFKIAYAKMPYLLKTRRYNRPMINSAG